METRFFLHVAAFACLLSLVTSQCDIKERLSDVPFPDIFKDGAGSYVMAVEYTLPAAKQTDYYTEYYDSIMSKGRVDSHINSQNQKYIYNFESLESWTIVKDKSCKFTFTNETADFFKSDQTEWRHFSNSTFNPSTIGPSAMFKYALDVWKNQKKDARTMAYMGKSKDLIRGEAAVYWRRCTEDGKDFVDYYFADSIEETGSESANGTPLRVNFYGVSEVEQEELSYQFYDIISFNSFIPAGVDPFQLPKGLNCYRIPSESHPDPSDFSEDNVYFSAEVLYERFSTKNNGMDLMRGYYSTLTFGLNRKINHLMYFTSQWNNTKPNKDEDQKPKGKPVEKFIYDFQHAYLYSLSLETGNCKISREEGFVPQYTLPENRGSIAITDSSVLLPTKKRPLKYLTEGKVRGLDVNIFEIVDDELKVGDEKTIDKVVVTHSYLKSYIEVENTAAVKQPPVQMEIRVYRTDNTLEVLTFNIFSFTTRMPTGYFFDVSSCFRKDGEYTYLTIGFEIDPPELLPQIQKRLPQFEDNVVAALIGSSQLNIIRISKVMTDMKDDFVYVTMNVLNRPAYKFDFPKNQTDKSIKNVASEDIQGIASFDECAQNCLEVRGDCWGFALCGATCYYGSGKSTDVEPKKGCTLYNRYSKDTPILSNRQVLNNVIGEIESEEFKVMVPLDNGMETLTATIAQETIPSDEESLFNKMGNIVNERMRVVQAGFKLKTGTSVKNLGKLRYDECQSLCLDFKDCETVSFCLIDSDCVISNTYATDLKSEDKAEDQFCNLLARQYSDHFEKTPGITVQVEGDETLELTDLQDCARACLKESKFDCLSFDHCSGGDKKGCTLHKLHYLKPGEIKDVKGIDVGVTCGHYSKKFSSEFKRKDQTSITGSKITPIHNVTMEECAKTCMEYGKGTCYGYDFCQDQALFATSCVLFDTDPSRLTSKSNNICTHYSRTAPEFVARPFSNSYAGGIGFLCFLIGGVLGAAIVFVIAYIRMNRG